MAKQTTHTCTYRECSQKKGSWVWINKWTSERKKKNETSDQRKCIAKMKRKKRGKKRYTNYTYFLFYFFLPLNLLFKSNLLYFWCILWNDSDIKETVNRWIKKCHYLNYDKRFQLSKSFFFLPVSFVINFLPLFTKIFTTDLIELRIH